MPWNNRVIGHQGRGIDGGDLKKECLAIPVGGRAHWKSRLDKCGVQRAMCVCLWVLHLSFNYDFLSKWNPQRTSIDRTLNRAGGGKGVLFCCCTDLWFNWICFFFEKFVQLALLQREVYWQAIDLMRGRVEGHMQV